MANKDLINQANDALLQRILTKWPEVTPVDRDEGGSDFGIYFAEDIAALALKNMKEPFCIIAVGQWTRSDLSGIGNKVLQSTYMIYYCRANATTNRVLREKIKDLESYLNDPVNDICEITDGTQIGNVEAVSHSRNLPMNREFIDRELPFRAAALVTEIIITDD